MKNENVLTKATCTVDEAATLLGISRDSAYKAAQSGDLPVLRFGRRLLVSTARLRQMLGIDDGPRAA